MTARPHPTGSSPSQLFSSPRLDAATTAALEAVLSGASAVLTTSGSTGSSRPVRISSAAIHAAIAASAACLGGPSDWLLALPTNHIAGLMVAARALAAGTAVASVPVGHFGPETFLAGCDALDATSRNPRRTVSLVPTQLHRLLTATDPAAARRLREFDSVLLGGAAAPGPLLAAAAEAGVAVVRTYGMTETCGGCVYDGIPLAGVDIAVRDDQRIALRGPMLADCYLAPDGSVDSAATQSTFVDGWLLTGDRGRVDAAGRLEVLGRLDDFIISGGHNVEPRAVEDAVGRWLAAHGGASGRVCAVGVPDPEWGHRVVVLVAGGPWPDASSAAHALPLVRAAVTEMVGSHSAPTAILPVADLPQLQSGKLDRAAAARMAVDLVSTVS